jgi:VanZ family protein
MTAGLARAALALVSILILALTLTPVAGAGAVTVTVDLLAFRGAADAVANILLFMPFGVCAALVFRGAVRPIAAALGLSILIEMAQLAVPGRFVSSTDILFNTAGAAAGLWLVRSADSWVNPVGWARWLLPAGALTAALTVLAAGGALLVPDIPTVILYGQWTATFENMTPYGGEVLSAFVGTHHVPSRRIIASDSLRAHLMRGEELRLRVMAGPPPRGLAPIFSIYDEYEREMLLVGADGEDLVLRYRMRSTSARLDQPDLRVRHALADVEPGAGIDIRVRRQDRGYCIVVRNAEWCGLGFTLSDTWALLLYPVPRPLDSALRFAWVGLLVLPAGFWLRRARYVAAAWAVTGVVLLVAPSVVGILDSPPSAYLSAFTALLAGHGLGRFAGSRSGPRRTARSARTPDRIPLPPDRTDP